MSQENSAELQVHYTAEGASAVQDLLGVFGEVENGTASLNAVQSATKALKAALNDLVTKHAHAAPQLHRLRKFVDALRDDEFFLLLPEPSVSTAEKYDRERLLHRLNHPRATTARVTIRPRLSLESSLKATTLRRRGPIVRR